MELGMMCTDGKDIEELNEMYGLCVGVRQRPRRLQETDVVRNYEGVQLQGHIYMVQVRKGKRNSLSRTDNSETGGKI